ncbi:MAG: transketolase [Planctomycetes bacterium]|nr:transketolase [Planctomycetota bacterium]
MDAALLKQKAREIRATCLQMSYDGQEGHLSSALTAVDVLVALYYGWLRVFPDQPRHPQRDRFILSKGHGCTALYAVLADRGFFPRGLLREYNRERSALPNHPCIHALPLLEFSAGSLGHGLGIAAGMLYGLRLKGSASRAAVVLGDGECNEGSVWEAAMFAAAHRLDRLLAVVDYNGIQAVGRSDDIMGHTSLEEKFRAFGWAAATVDGSDPGALLAAMERAPFEPGRPSAIVARTRMGVSFMEGDVLWHYRKPSREELQRALAELGARPIYEKA